MKKESFQKLVLTGVFAALSYVVFTFLQIKIPLPGGDATSIHLGNAVCVLGALILGGLWGGIGGSIGMTIGEMAEYMLNKGVTVAYNLDGGGSTTMYFNDRVINHPCANRDVIEERSVTDILYIEGETD